MIMQPYPMHIVLEHFDKPALVVGWVQDTNGETRPLCIVTADGVSVLYRPDWDETWILLNPQPQP